jgi:hypothetical protein
MRLKPLKTSHCYHLAIFKTAIRLRLFKADARGIDARRGAPHPAVDYVSISRRVVLDLFFRAAMFSI